MAAGMGCRGFMGPLLFVNLVMYVTVLGLAGWAVDKYIDGETHHHLGGNASTTYLLVFSLLAGAVGACSTLTGFQHVRAWRGDSLAGALSSALVSWALTALTFGFYIAFMDHFVGYVASRASRFIWEIAGGAWTLEAFVVILTATQLVYILMLHAGIVSSRYGPGYRNYDDYGEMMESQKETAAIRVPPDA